MWNASGMVVPVTDGAIEDESMKVSGESLKPRIISELKKKRVAELKESTEMNPRKSIYSQCLDKPRMSGVLHCARSEWSPCWEARYAEVKHGSLELYLPENGGPPPGGTRPRRRLPLRNLSIHRVPRRHHAFALCPKETHADPILLCQVDNADCFLRWTRTLAVELMKQTPLGDVRFLDILRITETPHPDDEPKIYIQEKKEIEMEPEEVEHLKDLCQKGCATVTERRRLFEVLGSGRAISHNKSGSESHRILSSYRSCTSSEDLGNSVIKYPSHLRVRPKRAKSLHDLPSDFPVACTVEGGVPIPISIVSQLRLHFERITQNSSKTEKSGCTEEDVSKIEFEKQRIEGESIDSEIARICNSKLKCTKGKVRKSGRSLSYSYESMRKCNPLIYPSYGIDNVFLNNVGQKLYEYFYPGCDHLVKDKDGNHVDVKDLLMYTKEKEMEENNRNGCMNEEMSKKSYINEKLSPIIPKLNSNKVANSSSPLCIRKLSTKSNHYHWSPPNSFSSVSSTVCFKPLGESVSSFSSSLSTSPSSSSSSPSSSMSRH